MGKCTKRRCPMQYDAVDENCDIKDCPYRTEQSFTMEDFIDAVIYYKSSETAKELFGVLIKSAALCESRGGHSSWLDYLIVKARQHGLEYVGLDKDGNVIWAGDTITEGGENYEL